MRAGSDPRPAPRRSGPGVGDSDAHFRILFEHTQDGVVIIDAEANIVAVNPAFAEITGYAESELLHQNPFLMRSGHH